MSAWLLVLRLIHIAASVFWVGSALFITLLLAPSLKALGPVAGPVMAELRRRRFQDALLGAALAAILSGFALLWLLSSGLDRVWLRSGFGVAILVGSAASLLALLIALVWIRPIGGAMAELEQRIVAAGRPAAEQERVLLQGYRTAASAWSVRSSVCLMVALVAMAVARYL